ncbi:MAG: caspase family protein, partial [bacterium]
SLDNAVSDAEGVLAAFGRLGFVPMIAPLFNDEATFDEIERLPGRLGRELDWNDSLVVFFAGHGYTAKPPFAYGLLEQTGYLIPFDAEHSSARSADEQRWQSIESWLSAIAKLHARHVLVILDSCYSGIALGRSTAYRGVGVRPDGSPVPFHERLGRWVLTSALGDQQAMDGGPFRGHSAFTGCLIQALPGGAASRAPAAVSVEQLAEGVQLEVVKHSHDHQVPALGWLPYHDHGKLWLSLEPARPETRHPGVETSQEALPDPKAPKRPDRTKRKRGQPNKADTAWSRPDGTRLPPSLSTNATPDPTDSRRDADGFLDRTEGWALDPPLAAALDRQGEERRRGALVLTIVAGEAMAAQTSWGTWAAGHGYLTLTTQTVGLNEAVADLLAQTPWLRCVPAARVRLAEAARIDAQAVDASLDARGIRDQQRWIESVASLDPHAQVGGWILSSIRRPSASTPDLTTAPVKAADLLAIACDLSSPTAVLLFHPTPDEQWLERAIVTAAELIPYLPAHSVAVTAPEALVSKVLGERRRGAAFTMARQGLVKVKRDACRIPGRARSSTMRVLFDALARDPRTCGRFELDGRVVTDDGPTIHVALVAHQARIAVELDAWYQFHDPEGYRRDRQQDTRLQRAGYF